MASFDPLKSNLLHMEVINAIINAIVSGEYKPGERIIEQNIAEQMQISRAPVREAIRELAAHDIIRFLPRKGAYVAPLEYKSIKESYSLRSCLEGLAAKLATNYLTQADLEQLQNYSKQMEQAVIDNDADSFIEGDLNFHNLICQISKHSKLLKMIEGVRLQTKLYMVMSKWNLVAHSQLNREKDAHEPILQAFMQKDGDEAERRMREHIVFSGDLLIEYLNFSPQSK
ncbi:MAG: GntR family transcriptional regulator [Clostridia bacterium]